MRHVYGKALCFQAAVDNKTGCFTLIVVLLVYVCLCLYVSLPQGVMSWHVICDCDVL